MQLQLDKGGGQPHLPKDRRFSLLTLNGKNTCEEFQLEKTAVTIGRDASVSDLILDDLGASRAHASLEFAEGTFVIEDLKSRNGISVNQKPVTRAPLAHGDKITIGKTSFKFLVETVEPGFWWKS
jgi:pSer/pThr/pTyr-binding forkhead associated (FHA) protein